MNNITDINSTSESSSPNITKKSLPTIQVPVLVLSDFDLDSILKLLAKYQLKLHILDDNQTISGSFWGDSEAGLINKNIYARKDTPLHSLLHETCHFICMDNKRRQKLNTDAKGNYDEENAVCYLQILLANKIIGFSSERMMQDMDSWGYTFRLGSAKSWFEKDSEDALAWLKNHKLLDSNNHPNFTLRQ